MKKALLFCAGAGLLFSNAVLADLVPDAQAHRACLNRFEAISQQEGVNLRAEEIYLAPQPSARRHTYFFNATERGVEDPRQYRIECEARKIGRVTRFELEPGSWRFETPEAGYASR